MELLTRILELVTAVICWITAREERKARAQAERRRRRGRRNRARRQQRIQSNGQEGLAHPSAVEESGAYQEALGVSPHLL